jgi:hypothetical protein
MDPYIEAWGDWLDFHGRFIAYCCDYLNERLPEGYAASLDTQLKLVQAEDDVVHGRMRPDLSKHRDPEVPISSRASADRGREGVATIEPQILTLPVNYDEIRESAVQIISYPRRRLVTHIELLSPTNKRNPGRGEYVAKRVALTHQQKVSMVEIDLLLSGERLETVESLPHGDYYAFVTRADRLPNVDVYAWSIRRPLPPIPVPLLPPDADVLVDLAMLVAQVYDRGRYRQLVAYDRALDTLPLPDPERLWATHLAAARNA